MDKKKGGGGLIIYQIGTYKHPFLQVAGYTWERPENALGISVFICLWTSFFFSKQNKKNLIHYKYK